MKAKIFLLVFLSIPFGAFGQGSISISKDNSTFHGVKPVQYDWYVSGGAYYLTGQVWDYVNIGFYENNWYTVSLTTTNGSFKNKDLFKNYYMLILIPCLNICIS